MSWFGDGSFKQEILDEIEYKKDGKSNREVVIDLLEIVKYYTRFEYTDEIYLKAKEDAKQELLAALTK